MPKAIAGNEGIPQMRATIQQTRRCWMAKALSLAAPAFCLGGRIPPLAAQEPGEGKPSPAPDFRLQARDGSRRSLRDYRGKLLLLNFWATWCPPCRLEMPVFSAAQQKWRERGVAIVGIAMDTGGWRTVTPFLQRSPISYEILLGTPRVARDYRVGRVYPTTVVVDPAGSIVGRMETAIEAGDLDLLLERLTGALRQGGI